jgi:TPR repeat protein
MKSFFALALAVGAASAANLRTPVTGASAMDYGLNGTATTGGATGKATGMNYGLTGTAVTGGASATEYGLTGTVTTGGARATDYGLTGTATTGHHGATYGTAMPSYDETKIAAEDEHRRQLEEWTAKIAADAKAAKEAEEAKIAAQPKARIAVCVKEVEQYHYASWAEYAKAAKEAGANVTTKTHYNTKEYAKAVKEQKEKCKIAVVANAAKDVIWKSTKYYITELNENCKISSNVITSQAECKVALFAVGKSDEIVYDSVHNMYSVSYVHYLDDYYIHSSIPGGCSVRGHDEGHYDNRGKKGTVGAKRDDLRAVCKGDKATSTTFNQQKVLHAKEKIAAPLELVASMSSDDPGRIQTALLRCHACCHACGLSNELSHLIGKAKEIEQQLMAAFSNKNKAFEKPEIKEWTKQEMSAFYAEKEKELAAHTAKEERIAAQLKAKNEAKKAKKAADAKAAKEVIWKSTKYYITKLNENCKISSNVITSQAECKIALIAVGKSDRIVYNSVHSGIPGGCSVRGHSDGHYDNRGKKGTVGAKRRDLRAVCKGDKATSTTFNQQKVLQGEAGSKKDIERLRVWVKKGKVWAMGMLADRYKDGVGVKQSNKKAIELYETAAKRGNASAQHQAKEKICSASFKMSCEKKATYEKNKYVPDPICTNHLHAARKLLNQADIVISSIFNSVSHLFDLLYLGSTQKKAENEELKKITSGMGYLKEAIAQLDLTRYSHGAVNTVHKDRNGELEDLLSTLRKKHDLLQRMAKAWQIWILKKRCYWVEALEACKETRVASFRYPKWTYKRIIGKCTAKKFTKFGGALNGHSCTSITLEDGTKLKRDTIVYGKTIKGKTIKGKCTWSEYDKKDCLGPLMGVYTSNCGGDACYDSGIKLVHEPLRRLIEDGSKKTSWVPVYACGSKKD